ncbi:MAG: hypothetical protein AB1714_21055 [Acidobacteriota bacterium]
MSGLVHRICGRFNVSLISAVAVLGLMGVPSVAVSEDYSAWKLVLPLRVNTLDPMGRDGASMGHYRIEDLQADALGGHILLTVLGKEQCTGQTQRFQFNWKFDRDISRISGKRDDRVFSVTISIEGDENGCINANPFWYSSAQGDLLYRKPQSDRYYFKSQGEYRGPIEAFLYLVHNAEASWGWRIHIESLGTPWWTTSCIDVDYVYRPVTGSAGGDDNRARCEQYARRAVEQDQENQLRACGLSGARWHGDYDSHFNWCLGVDPSWAESETRARDEDLQKCKGKWPGLGGGRVLGGLDLDAYCKGEGAMAVRLDGDKWVCVYSDDSELAIDLDDACRKQYDEPGAIAVQREPGNPQTWTCVAPGR